MTGLIVKVLYFASARDLAEAGGERVTLKKGATVQDLAEAISLMHPGMKRLAQSVRFSVNRELAEGDSPLQEGDEVGVLPPVAGG